MNPELDAQFARATLWRQEALKLREILSSCGLTEARKWGKPCYQAHESNIAIIQRMKPQLALMFFQGVLMADPEGVLHKPGANSRIGRRIHFASMEDVERLAPAVRSYVAEAVALAASGATVETDDTLDVPDELQQALDEDPALEEAFAGLTPGRQREYCLHIGSAAQSATRTRRVEKHREKILAGKGFRDR